MSYEGFLDDLFEDDIPAEPAETFKKLTTAWINEKNSPDLLKYATDPVESMLLQIDAMENNLKTINKNDFRLVPHQMEINRIRFILADYHRCRLEKIEAFGDYLLKRDARAENAEERYMSVGEFRFAEEYITGWKKYLKDNAMAYMPTMFNNFDGLENSPNLNSVVFVEIVEEVDDFLFIDEDEIELRNGSKHLLPFKDVRGLIERGVAALM